MSTYAVGATVMVRTEVRNGDGDLVNPVDLKLTIRLPDGTTEGPFTPDNDGVGLYSYAYATTVAGRHVARWASTNPTAIDEEPFDVAGVWAEAGIFSLNGARRYLRIPDSDHSEDDELAEMVRAVTDIVERHAGTVLPRVCTERHRGGASAILLDHRPVISVTSVTLPGGGVLDPAGYELDADAGVLTRMSGDFESCWEPGRSTVVYTAGRADVEASVRQGARVILKHLWETQRSRMGGARSAGSDEVWDPRWGYSIPRRGLELLGDQPMGIA